MARPKILFLLFEGLPRSVIDTQVLMHARTAGAELGIDFEIWSFACSRAVLKAAQNRRAEAGEMAGCHVEVHAGIRPAFPGARSVNRYRVRRLLIPRVAEFSAIHARTDAAAAVVGPLAQELGVPVIWDCRGDGVAEFDARMGSGGNPLVRWRRREVAADRAIAGSTCAGAIFVSRPLAELCKPELGSKPSCIIPCAAPDDLFYFDPALRQQTRQQLGFSKGERVFVYSGGMAPYQCFGETVVLFREIRAKDTSARFLVLTTNTATAQRYLGELDYRDVTIRSVRSGEVNAYLNAADAAFMLRKENGVNCVASPTKFAEYCLAGLPVIMGDAVVDSAERASRWGNRIIPDAIAVIKAMGTGFDRHRIMGQARTELVRTVYMSSYSELYGLATAARANC